MACHEIAGLRLGLMQVLGIEDEAERAHEMAEIGDAAEAPGPLRSMLESRDLASLQRFYENAITGLQERVAATGLDDPSLPYLRTLIVATKKVELDMRNHIAALTRFYKDLDEMHDFIHEIYPSDEGV